MDSRWVFKELVNGDDDKIGLLAYSLYKYDKSEYAEVLRLSGGTDEQINAELKIFHRQTVNTPGRIKGYRHKASLFIDNLMDQLDEGIRLTYEEQLKEANKKANEIAQLKDEIVQMQTVRSNEIKVAGEEAVVNFHRAVELGKIRERHWGVRSLLWFWNGFSGVFAAIAFAIGVYGVCTLALPYKSREDVINGAINNLKNALFQPPGMNKENNADAGFPAQQK
ncbi:hypothetical protein AAEY27_15775 [Kosakonia sp. BYX6]|uniref:Uncharacterized protein n=1 Tax=Kosakonia calanthes TaxID=3139408 RepID=A0ABZ3B1W8_9ENTR